MPLKFLNLDISNSGSRNEVRMKVVYELSKEDCGKGKGDLATKYVYYVETLLSGDRIYLARPAFLHNGFDFVVNVENMYFNEPNKRKRTSPSHENILSDLRLKKSDDLESYLSLLDYVEKIYNCENVDFSKMENLIFKNGYPVDLILKVLKWLFIEQDIRYWNYSGRDMLMSAIRQI